MSGPWVAAFAVGWVVLVLLVAVVLVLVRQVAELRARLDERPAPPEVEWDDAPDGVALYDRVPAFAATVLHDGHGPATGAPATLALGGVDGDAPPALLVFHSPGCMSCAGIERTLERTAGLVGDVLPDVRVLSVLALDDRPATRHLREHGLDGVATIRFDDLPAALQPDTTPALVGIGREGLVCAVGRPATPEELLEAARACDAPVLTADADAVRVTDWGQTVPFWEPRAPAPAQ